MDDKGTGVPYLDPHTLTNLRGSYSGSSGPFPNHPGLHPHTLTQLVLRNHILTQSAGFLLSPHDLLSQYFSVLSYKRSTHGDTMLCLFMAKLFF